jgi:threonine dehydratase
VVTLTIRAVEAPARVDIDEAWARISGYLQATPVVRGSAGLLKLESLQPTGSFKVRGGLSALSRLERGDRVVTASAGNHGLGIAYAASLLGIEATVVVPETASGVKLEALSTYPIRLVRHGRLYDDAEHHALELAEAGARYISPYNDRDVIAGQGTVAIELLSQVEAPLTIVCPIGGGGLASGIGLWASGCDGVRVVGVETQASAAMRAALDADGIVPINVGDTIADGLGGNLEPGSVTFDVIRRHVAEVLVVTEAELEEGVRFLVREHGIVAEAAGAAGVAAILAGRIEPSSAQVATIVTGRNIDARLLARILAGSSTGL